MTLSNLDLDLANEIATRLVAAATARTRLALVPCDTDACVECGEPIPAARKRAMPAARHCVDCAELLEDGR